MHNADCTFDIVRNSLPALQTEPCASDIMDTKLLLLLAPIVILEFVMKGIALFNLRKQEHTRGPKLLWAILILLTTAIGWICYFAVGQTDEA